MKCVAIGGVPATGKTTLVKMIYNKMPKINFEYGLVKGHYDKHNNIALLGLYNQNNTFLGTDRLSMGVNKQFLQYIYNVFPSSHHRPPESKRVGLGFGLGSSKRGPRAVLGGRRGGLAGLALGRAERLGQV